jgi:NAD(P)H-hydrate epimerase
MSSKYGFSIDQLMELAGLSVAMSIGKEFPICSTSSTNERILIVAGPGNNG